MAGVFFSKRKYVLLIVALMLLVLIGLYVGTVLRTRKVVDAEVVQWEDRIAGLDEIAYQDLTVDPLGRGMRLKDVSMTLNGGADIVRVDDVSIKGLDVKNGSVVEGQLTAQGVHLHRADGPLEQLKTVLVSMGYKDPQAQLTLHWHYHAEERTLTITTLDLEVPEAGSLSLSAHLGNIDAWSLLSALRDKIYLLTALPAISVESIDLRYEDNSLFKRLPRIDRHGNMALLQAYVGNALVENEPDQNAPQTPIIRQNWQALADFLTEPHSLHIQISPKSPVALLQLFWTQSPEQVMRLLGMEVTANEVTAGV